MTLGIQQLTPSASALTSFSAVPTGKQWLWNIVVCNKASAQALIRIGVTVGATTTYYEYDTLLYTTESLEHSGRKLTGGGLVSVRTDTAGVDFTLEYVEE